MIKRLTILVFCVLIAMPSFAQNSSTAGQTVHIQVAPAIEILTNTLIQILQNWKNTHGNGFGNGFGNNGKSVQEGNNATVPNQEIIVRSNKDFIVSVKGGDDNTGDNLLMALVDNRTGGKANPAFSEKGFAPVGNASQDLLSNCSFGSERSFAVNYKTTASKTKESRPTKADIIYTATLP